MWINTNYVLLTSVTFAWNFLLNLVNIWQEKQGLQIRGATIIGQNGPKATS